MLRRILNSIVERHEALRTRFRQVGGQPVQVIAEPGTGMVLEEHDLRGISDAQDALQRIGEEEVATGIDREQGPLIRSRLVQLDDEDTFCW